MNRPFIVTQDSEQYAVKELHWAEWSGELQLVVAHTAYSLDHDTMKLVFEVVESNVDGSYKLIHIVNKRWFATFYPTLEIYKSSKQ